METQPLIVEETFNAPLAQVWKAISSLDQMKKWYFDLQAFEPEPGFEFQFPGGTEEKTYIHLCKVTEVTPGQKLSYSWRYQGYPGNTLVTFELHPQENKTRLRLSHEGLETFPADNPDFARDRFAQGWEYIIGTSLKGFLNGSP